MHHHYRQGIAVHQATCGSCLRRIPEVSRRKTRQCTSRVDSHNRTSYFSDGPAVTGADDNSLGLGLVNTVGGPEHTIPGFEASSGSPSKSVGEHCRGENRLSRVSLLELQQSGPQSTLGFSADSGV